MEPCGRHLYAHCNTTNGARKKRGMQLRSMVRFVRILILLQRQKLQQGIELKGARCLPIMVVLFNKGVKLQTTATAQQAQQRVRMGACSATCLQYGRQLSDQLLQSLCQPKDLFAVARVSAGSNVPVTTAVCLDTRSN
jgi:hypothetical protein